MKAFLQTLAAMILGFVVLILLAACVNASDNDSIKWWNPYPDYKTANIDLPDGREVTCIFGGRSNSAISCDWENAR